MNENQNPIFAEALAPDVTDQMLFDLLDCLRLPIEAFLNPGTKYLKKELAPLREYIELNCDFDNRRGDYSKDLDNLVSLYDAFLPLFKHWHRAIKREMPWPQSIWVGERGTGFAMFMDFMEGITGTVAYADFKTLEKDGDNLWVYILENCDYRGEHGKYARDYDYLIAAFDALNLIMTLIFENIAPVPRVYELLVWPKELNTVEENQKTEETKNEKL